MRRIGHWVMPTGLAASVLMTLSIGVAPARADCYEDIGCTDSDMMSVDDLEAQSCQNMWHVRNRIYDENGHCFTTARGRHAFDNSDCWVKKQSNVKLSAVERHNVNAIVEAEGANGCD
jgi:hypothetical protein